LHTIPETIIVGLSTAPQNNFEKFEKFITNEVIPFVETKYRKTNSKTLIGHSSDGEFVLHNLFSNDSPFQNYFCTAPKNSGFFITQLKKQEALIFLKESNRKLFFGASHQDYFYDENIELIKAFDEMDKGSFLFHSSIKTSDTHHTIFPNLLTDALLFIYKDWHFSIPESNPEKTTELYIEHYKVLSQKNLEEIVPPEFDFYLLAYILDSRQHTEEKIELLKKCKELYPKADNADAYLGRTYYMIGDLQNAERFNDNALLLNSNNGFAKQTKDLIEKKKE
jgi:tetratricopeptide (TPR) repeat protein